MGERSEPHTGVFMLHRARVLNNVVIPSLKWMKWLKYSMEEVVSIQLSE